MGILFLLHAFLLSDKWINFWFNNYKYIWHTIFLQKGNNLRVPMQQLSGHLISFSTVYYYYWTPSILLNFICNDNNEGRRVIILGNHYGSGSAHLQVSSRSHKAFCSFIHTFWYYWIASTVFCTKNTVTVITGHTLPCVIFKNYEGLRLKVSHYHLSVYLY